MLPRAALLGLLVGACTSSEPPPRAASTPPATRASTAVAVPTASPEVPPTAPEAAPDGACVQKSYELEPTAGARLWIHFERCGASGPSPATGALEGLDVGGTYRFTVRRGASKNFGDGAILLAAEKL